MKLDLDRMLAATRKGQWSVDEFDWSVPLEGADGLSAREKKQAGLALVFTAGLERQAARVFTACAEHVDDPRAQEIYRLFADDERRHAEAELLLARRYGVTWADLPLPIRWMFHELPKNFRPPNRAAHEVSSANIILFELALDSLLIPALKEQAADPLQAEVFRRIDIDESRHLAMDYWLLNRKGAYFNGEDMRTVIERDLGRKMPLRLKLRVRYRLYLTMLLLLLGFGTTALMLPDMRRHLEDPDKMVKYLKRVAGITGKAPLAMKAPSFRMGLNGQRIIMNTIARISGQRAALDRMRAMVGA